MPFHRSGRNTGSGETRFPLVWKSLPPVMFPPLWDRNSHSSVLTGLVLGHMMGRPRRPPAAGQTGQPLGLRQIHLSDGGRSMPSCGERVAAAHVPTIFFLKGNKALIMCTEKPEKNVPPEHGYF